MPMTPLHIEIILYAYSRNKPVSNWYSPAAKDYTESLIDYGLLLQTGFYANGAPVLRVTDKGKAFMAMLLATPMPEQAWVNPVSKEQIEL